jgi:RNA polymerase primary sigma factor
LTDLIAEILRLSRRMRLEAGRGPSAAELAGYLHLPLAEVRDALVRAKDLAARARGGAACGGAVPGGLDEALTVEEERALDSAIEDNLRKTTTRVLASLTPRERHVLRMRFGIAANTDHTLEEFGRHFAETRERIRQIEAKALRKLKRKDPEDD